MFNYSNGGGYSLADIAAATGGANRNNNGFGDGNWAWLIIILLFCGWGGDGDSPFNRGGGGSSTQREISYSFDFNNLENGVRGIQQGLADGFYAMNTGMLNGFNGVQSTLCQGFSGVNDAITQGTIANMQNTFGLQTALNNSTVGLTAQLTNMAADNAACCCSTQTAIREGFGDLGYALATQSCETRRAITDSTRDIIDNNNTNTRAVLDFLTQDKIATLTAENQALKFAASQAEQSNYIAANQEAQTAELIRRLQTPQPQPAFIVNPPYPVASSCNSCCV